jgi:hypothetical protein
MPPSLAVKFGAGRTKQLLKFREIAFAAFQVRL